MKTIISFIWQLPQNIIGYLLIKITKATKSYASFNLWDVIYWKSTKLNKSWSGVSLGKYIVLASYQYATEPTLKHEYGHQIQSKKYGWFYLLLVGLPSFLGNIYHRIFHKNWDYSRSERWYYSQPWEKGSR